MLHPFHKTLLVFSSFRCTFPYFCVDEKNQNMTQNENEERSAKDRGPNSDSFLTSTKLEEKIEKKVALLRFSGFTQRFRLL
jgi:hypothetical protein